MITSGEKRNPANSEHPNHFDVQLAAATPEQVVLFLEAAGALRENPYQRKERA